MDKLELMKKFSSSFVGDGPHLVIREGPNGFVVYTIEIMQKTDETCPLKSIPVGDYFFHLVAKNQDGKNASIVCDWTSELLQNLLDTYAAAKEAGHTYIEMFKNPAVGNGNDWILRWDSFLQPMEPAQAAYVC